MSARPPAGVTTGALVHRTPSVNRHCESARRLPPSSSLVSGTYGQAEGPGMRAGVVPSDIWAWPKSGEPAVLQR